MTMKRKLGTEMLLLAVLLVSVVFLPAASAQEYIKTSDKPSELEQGLINALNSNTKNSPIDDVIADYFKANKDKISIQKNSAISDKNYSKRYQLKDGSNITFTNEGFSIGILKEVNKNTIQSGNKSNRMNPQWVVPPAYTPSLSYTHNWYNYAGTKYLGLTTQGYFGYDYNSVKGYCTDAWYSKYIPLNPWQVSNWVKGSQSISSSTAEIYGSGRFTWGYTVAGNYIEIDNRYLKAYIRCDKMGRYYGDYLDA